MDRNLVIALLFVASLAGCRSSGVIASKHDLRSSPSLSQLSPLPLWPSPYNTSRARRSESRDSSELADVAVCRDSLFTKKEVSPDSTEKSSDIVMASRLTQSVTSEVDERSASNSANPSGDATASTDSNETSEPERSLRLYDIVQSVYATYPLLQIAFFGRNIVAGEQTSAEGAWDLKLKADANNAPIGYYRTYRNGTGFEQPLYGGGEVYGLYKLGQGNFEPWYGNRETNKGGEFSAGIRIPLAQNRAIDDRRAALWKANFGVNAAEPMIQAQIIEFVRAGTYAYWDWVAAGINVRFSRELLELAEERDDQLENQVNAGARPESFIVDNRRLIVSREVKLIDVQRKLQTSAIKLSLFFRTPDGEPVIPSESQLPDRFPVATPLGIERIPIDVAEALSRRPELVELNLQHRMAQIDLERAQNMMQPEIDANLWSAKDVGGSVNPLGTKTPYQAEAGLNFSVPLQRRKALGKVTSSQGKLVQISTKRRFTENKIATEVHNSLVTIDAAYRSIAKAHESVSLNEKMLQFEVVKLDNGDSDLLLLNLREAATFDARLVEIEALLHYFTSIADYRAAMALEIAEPSQNQLQ